MALPAVIPTLIPLYRGDSFSMPVRVFSDAEQTTPVDLTLFGSVFTAQLRTTFRAAVEVPFDVDDTDAATGVLVLSLTPAQTGALDRGSYGFDAQAANADATVVTTLIAGKLAVSGDYTRAVVTP